MSDSSRFVTKYANVKMHNIDPFSVDDADEIDWLIMTTSNVIGSINEQMDLCETEDSVWYAKARRARHCAYTLNKALETRRTALRQQEKNKRRERQKLIEADAAEQRLSRAEQHAVNMRVPRALERAFMDVAKTTLPKATYQQILGQAMVLSAGADDRENSQT